MEEAAILIGIMIFLAALIVGALIGAVILRAAVAIFNKLHQSNSGSSSHPDEFDDEPRLVKRNSTFDSGFDNDDFDNDDFDDDNFDERPRKRTRRSTQQSARRRRRRRRRRRPRLAIPEPSFGKAMGIVLLSGVANWIVGFIIGFLIAVISTAAAGGRPPGEGIIILVQVISLIAGVFVMAGVIAGLLPTTYTRGLLVTLLYYLVLIAVAIVIGLVVAAVMFVVLSSFN